MHQHFWHPLSLVIIALALTAVGPSAVHAQDRPDAHRDDHGPARPDDRRPDDRHVDDRRPDPAVQYRHDHPGSSARCHDGFFTRTQDRNRACSKHGGIDVWLVL
jgi:hypothetical protein